MSSIKIKAVSLLLKISVIAIICIALYLIIDGRTNSAKLAEYSEDMGIERSFVKADFAKAYKIRYIQQKSSKSNGRKSSSNGGNSVTSMPDIKGGKLSVDATKKYLYLSLKSFGYDDDTIAGIMGNIEAESEFNFGKTQSNTHNGSTNTQCKHRGNCYTDASNANAHGIVQWDGGRRHGLLKKSDKAGVDWIDPQFQMQFLKNEITGNYYGRFISPNNIYKNVTSSIDKVEWAVYKWAIYYEVCQGTRVNGGITPYSMRAIISQWNRRYGTAVKIRDQIEKGDFGN